MAKNFSSDRIQKATQREFKEVQKIVKSFDKTFHVMKVYPADSPAVINTTEVLFLEMHRFLDAYDSLFLGVDNSAFLFEEKVVERYENETKCLPFLFFKDGVRQLSFDKGLEQDEFTDFMWTLKINADLPIEECDIVTALWEKNFPHIGYFALDNFLDTDIGDIEDKSVFEVEKEELSKGSVHLDDDDNPGQDISGSRGQGGDFEADKTTRGEGGPYSSILPTKEAVSAALSEAEEEKLQKQINDIRNASSLNELIVLIFEILYLEDRHFQFSALLNVLEKCIPEAVQEKDYEEISLLLHRLKELQNILTGHNDEKVLIIERFKDKVRNKASIKTITDHYQEGKIENMDAFFDYLKFLGQRSLPLLCKILDESEDSPIRHRTFGITDAIVRTNINELSAFLPKYNNDVIKTLIPIIVSIGEKGIIPLLAILSESKNPDIKIVLIHALGTFEYGYANRTLLKFLHDKDPEIRLQAAKNLNLPADKPVIEALVDLVQKKRFKKRQDKEMTEIFKFLAGTDNEEVFELFRSFLQKTSLFGKRKQDKVRLAVIQALELNGSQKAVELLLEGKIKSHKMISRACEQSLQKLSDKKELPKDFQKGKP
ncbi:MAG: HEAT repeat domain-containing protein [Candidatus Aminicenantes bacterium]|nr:HEAT repeat domain-containing protein [Candidatus Aminicenantes bacterium]